jgi:hypothetical protein
MPTLFLTKAPKTYNGEKTASSIKVAQKSSYLKLDSHLSPSAQTLRERMDKWDYMKLKSFYTTKEIVFKLKRLPTEWEKIFASYTSDN